MATFAVSSFENPLSLRAPIYECILETKDSQRSHDRSIRPTLCHLLAASEVLRLPVETTYTACVLLHRYFLANANASSDHVDSRWVVAACLLLACKSEEEPRRLRDLINCAQMISVDNEQSVVAKEGETVKLGWNPEPPALDDDYWKCKSKLVQVEQEVLRWLAFDCTVSHPHRAVVLFVQDAADADDDDDDTAAVTVHQLLITTAWKKLNDSVWHVAALQHPAWLLAVVAIRFAARQEQSADSPCAASLRDALLDFDRWRNLYGLEVNQGTIQTVEALFLG